MAGTLLFRVAVLTAAPLLYYFAVSPLVSIPQFATAPTVALPIVCHRAVGLGKGAAFGAGRSRVAR